MRIKVKMQIWYENHEGEIRDVEQEMEGVTQQQAIRDAMKNGFNMPTKIRGISRYIPPHRILSITYPDE